MLFGAIIPHQVGPICRCTDIGGTLTEEMAKDGYPESFSAACKYLSSSTTGTFDFPPSNVLI